MSEEELLTGPLEPTNEWYAIAKIAGIKLCQAYRRQYGADFVSVMPTNLYGPGDNYHPENSHVLRGADPALSRGKDRWRADSDGLGHRHAAARVHLRRRSGRCVRVCAVSDIPGEFASQCRHRQGRHDCRIGATRCGSRRLSRRTCLRRHAAGRHTAQAPRRVEAGSTRLECTHAVAARIRARLFGFCGRE